MATAETDPYRKMIIETKVVEECTSCNKRRTQHELRLTIWKNRGKRWLGWYVRFAHFAPVAIALLLVLKAAYRPFNDWQAARSGDATVLFLLVNVAGAFGLIILGVWWGVYIFFKGSDDE